jgi:hypothetical protein
MQYTLLARFSYTKTTTEYYHELIGGTSPNDSLETNIDDAPNWDRAVETNNPNGIPDRHIWTGSPGGKKIVMLNVDVAIVRDLNETNMDHDGRVNCTFRREGRCPHNARAIEFAIDCKFISQLNAPYITLCSII